MSAIYTHDEAAIIVDMFEEILHRYSIRVPSPEDDERDNDDYGLYGSVYSDLLDGVEARLIEIIKSLNKLITVENNNESVYITDRFSGNI